MKKQSNECSNLPLEKKVHISTEPPTPTKIRNNSRDYFKNFNVENFCVHENLSEKEARNLQNLETWELKKTVHEISMNVKSIRKELTQLSEKTPDESLFSTNSTPKSKCYSPRLTPDFVFVNDRISTELHKQVDENNLEKVLHLLLEANNDINYRDESGVTPLHVALRNRNNRLAEILLLHGADPSVTDENLKTGLHYASQTCNSEITDVILKHKPDVGCKDCKGETVLHYFARNNDAENALKILKFNEKERSILINSTNGKGKTALHIAALNGSVQFMEILINNGNGIDCSLEDNDGQTPLQQCISSKSTSKF